jgi:TolA-binding protein
VTGFDLHPEDLLEREVRGGLLPGEKDHLERHLRECAVCRFERATRDDFQEESERSDDELDVHRLLANVLVGGAATTQRVGKGRRRSRRGQILLAVGIAMIAGTAGAAVSRFAGSGAATPSHSAIDADETVPAPRVRVSPAFSSAPVSAVEAALSVPLPAPPPEVAQTTHPRASPSASSSVRVESEATAWRGDAAAVFSRANDARRSGDRTQAEVLYRLLVERHSSTPEAHQSEALLGQMFLDSGDAAAALLFFDGYLRKDGALREDVTLDRAAALQRLVRTDDEAAAWTALLQAYPESVHAERARKRLSELGKR